jgi:hypothetical protein
MEAPPSSPKVIRRQSNPSPARIASNATNPANTARIPPAVVVLGLTSRGAYYTPAPARDENAHPLLAAMLVAVAAACGGGGGSEAETEFRAEVNAVCAEAEELGFEDCSPTGITTGL